MKILNDLMDISFIGTAFAIYIISQFALGLIFIADAAQTSTGVLGRLKKLLEMAFPVILGGTLGYFVALPGPELIVIDPIARSIYFSFAGGLSALVHGAVETTFPQIIARMFSNLKNSIVATPTVSNSASSSEGEKKE